MQITDKQLDDLEAQCTPLPEDRILWPVEVPQDKLRALIAAYRAAQVLVQGIMPDAWDEWSPVEPDEMQELFHEAGILRKQRMEARCGESCFCAQEAGFPIDCNRYTELAKDLLGRRWKRSPSHDDNG